MKISNGQLKEHVEGGVSQNEFINRIRRVLGADAIPGTTPTPSAYDQRQPTSAPTDDNNIVEAYDHDQTTARNPPAPVIAPTSAKAKGKQKATPPDPNPKPTSTKIAQQSARDAVRKKKQEEKDEVARIQARIEADKAERKAQAEARKAERERLAESSPLSTQTFSATSTKGSQAKEVNLNVRLFDGRTIRSTFPRSATLQNDVRPWVDEAFAARAENQSERHPPYYFKQILAPLPSKELSAGDEAEAMGDIDLAPSATLVLIPVKGYTEAYSGGGGVVGGVVGGVTGIVGGAFNLAYNSVGYVGNALGSIVGIGGSETQPGQQTQAGRTLSDTARPDTPTNAANIRVRTLADQRDREPRSQELYNGNQVS